MKKVVLFFCAITCLVCSAFFFTACSDKNKLANVTGISFDEQTHTISWSAVENAQSYVVNAGGVEYTTEQTTITHDHGDQSFSVSIVAKADGYKDSNSTTINFHYLPLVRNIRVVDGIVHWDSVDGATGYIIKYNGVEVDNVVTTTSWDGLTPNVTGSVYVRAKAESTPTTVYLSKYSAEVTATLLTTPIIKFNAQSLMIYWDAVQSATGYKLVIEKDGVGTFSQDFGATATNQVYQFSEVGEYTVKLQANPHADSGLDTSKFGTYQVTRLGYPDPLSVVTETTDQGKTTVTFADVVKASGFKITVNNDEVSLDSRTSFQYKATTTSDERNDVVKIYSIGDGVSVLDSLEAHTFTLTRLATPQNVTSNKEKITWDSVDKSNNGYIVYLDGVPHMPNDNANEFNLPSLSAGSHKITVVARGNGKEVVNSEPSREYTINKLPAPQNLEIKDGLLTWSNVLGAQAYVVYINENLHNVVGESFEITDDNFTTSEATIKVVAIGNGSNILDSAISDTKTIYRLSAPEVSTDNDNIKWSEIKNATSYQLMVNSVEKIVETGRSMTWNEYSAGEKRVKVKACGDRSTFFDSIFSSEMICEKLETPVTTIVDDGYTWTAIKLAYKYEVAEDSISFDLPVSTRKYSPTYTTAGIKSIKVRALGDGITTISSSWSSSVNHTVKVREGLVGDPAFNVVKNGNDFTISINNPIYGASYVYEIGGTVRDSAETSYVYNMNGAGQFAVRIAVQGDGFNTVNSEFCKSQTFTILQSPSIDEPIFQEENYYVLRWSNVQSALSYKVKVVKYFKTEGKQPETVERTFTTNSTMLFTEDVLSVEVSVIACGNDTNVFNSVTSNDTFVLKGE